MRRLLRYYYLGFAYLAIGIGFLMMISVPIMLWSYVLAVLYPNDSEHWPWWTPIALLAYGILGFLIQKFAVWHVRRLKALASED